MYNQDLAMILVYRTIWTPTLGEMMATIYESGNPHNCYAIAARKHLPGTGLLESIVGHLPKKFPG
jgi:hypothetical protein